jgi:hypothetical protein
MNDNPYYPAGYTPLDPLPPVDKHNKHVPSVIERIRRGVYRVWHREHYLIRRGHGPATDIESACNDIMHKIDEHLHRLEFDDLGAYLMRRRYWFQDRLHVMCLDIADIDRAVKILFDVNRNMAFAMGHNQRLGGGSRVYLLDPGVIRMILDK